MQARKTRLRSSCEAERPHGHRDAPCVKGRGSINGDVKKKTLPLRKGGAFFLTSSSRPRLRGEHASILVVTVGTFRIMLLVATTETRALQSSVILATKVLSETRGLSLYRVVRGAYGARETQA